MFFIRLLLLTLMLMLIAANAMADTTASPPPLTAQFVTSVNADATSTEQREWRLWREPARIETQDITNNTGEIWTRDINDLQFHELLFHAERQIIEYSPVDLNLLNARQDWTAMAFTLDPVILDLLKPDGDATALNRPAQYYRGMIDGVHYDIVWLTEEQLPAMLIREIPGGGRIKTELTDLHALNEAPWSRPDTRSYRRLDFSDLGDMERDPFVASLMQGHTHAH